MPPPRLTDTAYNYSVSRLALATSSKYPALTDDDRMVLARWSQGGSPMLAERARIVLACAEPGSGVARVAAELGSTRMTVRKWRRRFAEDGLAGLADHDRPGRPVAQLVLTGEERAHTCHTAATACEVRSERQNRHLPERVVEAARVDDERAELLGCEGFEARNRRQRRGLTARLHRSG